MGQHALYGQAQQADVAGLVSALAGKLDTSAAAELIRDTVGTALVAGSNVTITPDDSADTITIAAAAGGGGGAGIPASEVNDWLSWTCDPLNAGTTPVITAGTIYLARFVLPVAATITGAWFYNAAAGVANTVGAVGIYDMAGVRKASSANITAAWQTIGDKQVPFAPAAALAAGDYYLAFLANGSTTPKPSCAPGARANMGLAAARLRCSSILTGQTVLPANLTLSGMASINNLMAFGLY